jgi:hypothetical protein
VPLDAQARAVDGFVAVLAHLATTAAEHWQGTIDDVDAPNSCTTCAWPSAAAGPCCHRRGASYRTTSATVPRRPALARRDHGSGARPRRVPARVVGLPLPARPDDTGALDPVRDHLTRQQSAAHEVLSATLAGDRARGVLDEWRHWLASVSDGRRRA